MKPTPIVPAGFGAPLGLYSHGMVVPSGELVVVAGQTGVMADGSLPGDDVGSQAKQALENVRAVLGAAGCAMTDIVRLQTFLVSADDIPAFMKARQEVFPGYFPGGVYPPNTLLIVSALVLPTLRVEIEAMAVRSRPGKKGRPVPARSASASRAGATARSPRRRRQ
jgi:enamine deaminase RidA (YjgF/YER057c/UK114 family)